jgi:WD40 repeat protein
MIGVIAFVWIALATSFPRQDARAYLDEFLAGSAALDANRIAEAENSFERCDSLSPRNPICAYFRACCAARSGKSDEALRHLARAIDWGYADEAVMRWDPDLAPLRSAAAFDDTIGRIPSPARSRLRLRLALDKDLHAYFGTPALSTDGTLLILPMTDGSMRGVDLAKGVTARHWFGGPSSLQCVVPWADGRGFSTFAREPKNRAVGHLSSWSASGGAPLDGFEVNAGWWWHAQEHFARDGRRLLSIAPDNRLEIFDAKRGRLGQVRALGEFWCQTVSADGSWMAAGTRAGEVLVFRRETGDDARIVFESRRVLDIPACRTVMSLAFHPTRPILAIGLEGTIEPNGAKVVVLDLDEDRTIQVLQHTDIVFSSWAESVAFSPDGRVLVSTDFGEVYAWDWEAGRRRWRHEFDQGDEMPMRIRFSADGSRVHFFGHGPGRSGVFDLASGTPVAIRPDLIGQTLIESPALNRLVTTGAGVTHVLDARSLDEMYSRHETKDGSYLLTTPAFYFSGSPRAIRSARAELPDRTEKLEDLAPRLLDPKRVRAAMAGVAVRVPAKL